MPDYNLARRPARVWSGARERCYRRARSTVCYRRSYVEVLEARRLLIAQGQTFAFTETFDTSGLLGDISAEVRWGDGTNPTSVSVSNNAQVGDIKIRFDYRYDNGFFSGQNSHRRQLMQIAADTLTSRLQDELHAIQPTSNITWAVSIINPSTGQPVALPASPEIAANEIVVYVGARELDGDRRGLGGINIASVESIYRGPDPCGTVAQCNAIQREIDDFIDSVETRGQQGATGNSPTDFAPYIGTVTFDSDTNWYDQPDPANYPGGTYIDFLSVATHELGHVLGIGIAPSWNRLAGGGSYSGSAANAAYQGNGRVPLEATNSGYAQHWNDSVAGVQPTLMTPNLTFTAGSRTEFSALDFAALDDIGWEVSPASATVSGSHQFNVPGNFTPEVVLVGDRAGEIVIPLDPVNVTPVTQSMTANFSSETVSEGDVNGIELTIERGDLFPRDPLFVNISGGPTGSLQVPGSIMIPANQSSYTIQVSTIDDDVAELARDLTFTFTADNHQTANASITVLDDERPLFQNPNDQFDVNGVGGVQASDALRIINELAARDTFLLDPESEQPNGIYVDVNGDYMISALDALNVINELANRASSEQLAPRWPPTPIQRAGSGSLDQEEKIIDAALAELF